MEDEMKKGGLVWLYFDRDGYIYFPGRGSSDV